MMQRACQKKLTWPVHFGTADLKRKEKERPKRQQQMTSQRPEPRLQVNGLLECGEKVRSYLSSSLHPSAVFSPYVRSRPWAEAESWCTFTARNFPASPAFGPSPRSGSETLALLGPRSSSPSSPLAESLCLFEPRSRSVSFRLSDSLYLSEPPWRSEALYPSDSVCLSASPCLSASLCLSNTRVRSISRCRSPLSRGGCLLRSPPLRFSDPVRRPAPPLEACLPFPACLSGSPGNPGRDRSPLPGLDPLGSVRGRLGDLESMQNFRGLEM
jgi:hypothetical protein